MTGVVVAGLTGVDLTILCAVLVVAIVLAIFCSTRKEPAPIPAPDPELKAAVDDHWKPTANGRSWSGADFVRPRRSRRRGQSK